MRTDLRIKRSEVAELDEPTLFEALASAVWPSAEDDEQHLMSLGTPGQRAMYTTMLFSRLICCDGLLGTIWNMDAWIVDQAILGFRHIGATDEARALQTAIDIIFPDGAPQSSDDRRERIDQLNRARLRSALDPLDEIFFNGEERLAPKWRAYVAHHPEEFFLDA